MVKEANCMSKVYCTCKCGFKSYHEDVDEFTCKKCGITYIRYYNAETDMYVCAYETKNPKNNI